MSKYFKILCTQYFVFLHCYREEILLQYSKSLLLVASDIEKCPIKAHQIYISVHSLGRNDVEIFEITVHHLKVHIAMIIKSTWLKYWSDTFVSHWFYDFHYVGCSREEVSMYHWVTFNWDGWYRLWNGGWFSLFLDTCYAFWLDALCIYMYKIVLIYICFEGHVFCQAEDRNVWCLVLDNK